MKKDDQIVVMNFSGIYRQQQFFSDQKQKDKNISWVEVQDLPGSNCYCDEEAGNYHYMSRIWLEKINTPFRLVVFDNHTDMQPPAFGGLLSCGGCIAAALNELPLLEEVILTGPDQAAFDQIEEEMREKVRFLSREMLLDMDEKETEAFFRSIDEDVPLYISVDKDVLCAEDASTTWSQGDMKLKELMDYLRLIFKEYDVIGIDICGECDPDCCDNNDRNEHANRELFGVWKEWRTQHEE